MVVCEGKNLDLTRIMSVSLDFAYGCDARCETHEHGSWDFKFFNGRSSTAKHAQYVQQLSYSHQYIVEQPNARIRSCEGQRLRSTALVRIIPTPIGTWLNYFPSLGWAGTAPLCMPDTHFAQLGTGWSQQTRPSPLNAPGPDPRTEGNKEFVAIYPSRVAQVCATPSITTPGAHLRLAHISWDTCCLPRTAPDPAVTAPSTPSNAFQVSRLSQGQVTAPVAPSIWCLRFHLLPVPTSAASWQ